MNFDFESKSSLASVSLLKVKGPYAYYCLQQT